MHVKLTLIVILNNVDEELEMEMDGLRILAANIGSFGSLLSID